MPHVDRRAREVVMRIVYDGAPESGKTTNIRQLAQAISLQRRGALASPGTSGRRTEFFDWMDFAGGYLDGRRVRCQVVSVPGQPELLRRRRYLLDTADAVIFVADSQRSRLEQSARDFQLLRRALARRQSGEAVGVLLQANKQDLGDAIAPGPLAEALSATADVQVIGAKAHVGEGVMQAFVTAVRLATDRLRELMLSGAIGDLPEEARSADDLYATLVGIDERASTLHSSASAESSRNEPIPEVPSVSQVASGALWPPVQGRESLLSVDRRALRSVSPPATWAPPDTRELRGADRWILHTSDRWRVASESEARGALLALVRRLVPLAELMPAGRTLFVGPDGDGWRMWMQTPRVKTLEESLAAAADANDGERVATVLEDIERADSLLAAAEVPADLVGLDRVAIIDGRVALLGLPTDSPPTAAFVASGLADAAREHLERLRAGAPRPP